MDADDGFGSACKRNDAAGSRFAVNIVDPAAKRIGIRSSVQLCNAAKICFFVCSQIWRKIFREGGDSIFRHSFYRGARHRGLGIHQHAVHIEYDTLNSFAINLQCRVSLSLKSENICAKRRDFSLNGNPVLWKQGCWELHPYSTFCIHAGDCRRRLCAERSRIIENERNLP